MIYLSAERKILSTKNSISRNTVLQNDREIKTFQKKQKLMEFITTRPAIQDTLKRIFKLKLKDSRQ